MLCRIAEMQKRSGSFKSKMVISNLKWLMKADIRIFIRKKENLWLSNFFYRRKVNKYAEQMGQPMHSLGPLVLSVAFGLIRL